MKTILIFLLFAGFVLAWHHFDLQPLPSVLPERQAALVAYENRTCHPTPLNGDVGMPCDDMLIGWTKPYRPNQRVDWLYYYAFYADPSNTAELNKAWKNAAGVSCDADGSEKTQHCTPELAAKQEASRKAKR